MGNKVCTCVISSEDLKPNHKNKELEDQLSSKLVTKDDFQINATLGRGGFGKVSLVTKKSNSKIFAMKSIKKSLIDKKNQQQHIKFERTILEVAKCPFVVNLRYAFQTADKLYMVMDFCQGGELFYHLRKAGTFSESKAKFYIAEISLALNYLHKKGIIYRDLKPENILLDKDGHIKITDFGLSKLGIKESDRTFTQCGTPEYLSPEIINGLGHDKAVDYWSLGALFYEMLTGDPPFYNQNKSKMFNDIVNKPVEIKSYFSIEAADLIKQLLTVNPKQRLQDIQAIKEHQFFTSFDWQQLESKKLKPPFIPKINSQYDVSNFHDDFTEEKAYDSSVQDNQWNVSKKLNNQYNGFTYVDESLKLNKLQSMEKGQIGSQQSQNNFAFASPKFQSIEKNQFFQQDSGSQNYIKMNGLVFPKVNSSQTEKNQTQLPKQQQPTIQSNGFDTAVQKIKAKSKKIIETKKLLAVAQ